MKAMLRAAGCAMVIGLVLAAAAGAAAQDDQRITQEAERGATSVIGMILRILVRLVFPAVAFLCFLYGVWKGVKHGEWGQAIMCIIAGIALAVLPGIVAGLFKSAFNSDLTNILGR